MQLLPNGKQQFFTASGQPLANGKVFFYLPNTSTPATTYQDPSGQTPNTNPVILDGNGQAIIYGTGSYRQVVQDANGVTIWDQVTTSPDSVSVSLGQSGVGQGVDMVANAAKKVASIAALRALRVPQGSDAQTVIVDGYSTAGDGGGGTFIWSATATNADDSGTIINPTGNIGAGRWLRLFTGAVNVKWFGAKGDGTTDDTTASQAALTATRTQNGTPQRLLWTKGTYKITNNLIAGSNQSVIFDPGVTINCSLPNESTSLFEIAGQSNVTFEGNGATLNGSRSTATPSIEGNSAGFYVYGTSNIRIKGFNISGFATDGITLTGDTTGSGPCQNVVLEGNICDNNRRNGLSIISVRGLQVIGGRYTNSNGAPNGPWAGIDVEPNSDCFIEDVTLIGVNTQGNKGPGVQIVPQGLSAVTGKRFHVNIIGGRSLYDGGVGLGGLMFSNGSAFTNKVYGEVVVRGFSVDSPNACGIRFKNWDAGLAPRVILDEPTVYNPDYNQVQTSNNDKVGIYVYCDSTQAITNLGNIVIRNPYVEDTRTTAWMPWGIRILSDSGKTIKNVRIENPKTVHEAASFATNVWTSATSFTDVDVVYTKPDVYTATGSMDISQAGGQRVTVNGNSYVLTIPLAANCNGLHYEVEAPAGATGTLIQAQTGDSISFNGGAGATTLSVPGGAAVALRSKGGTNWSATYIV